MAGKGSVLINFRANADAAIRETKKLVRSLDNVDDKSKKLSSSLKKGLAAGAVGVGAALAGAGAALINFGEAAVADAAAAQKLARTLKNVTKATDAQVESVEDWITKQGIALGLSDDKLRPAMARLVRSTKDVAKAQDLASLAFDISAGTGKDYNTVALALAKANDGQIVALKKLGITLGDAAGNAQEYNKVQEKLALANSDAAAALEGFGPASKEYAKAMDKVKLYQSDSIALSKAGIDWQKELSKEFAGQGAAQANSVQGTWAKIKLIFTEGSENVGRVVLKPLEEFANWLKDPKHVQEVEDFLEGVADAADAIGQEVVDRVREFLAYVQSPEGAANIRAYADALKQLGAGFLTVSDAFGTLSAKWNSLPSWLRTALIEGGKFAVQPPAYVKGKIDANTARIDAINAPAPSGRTPRANYDPRTGVIVNIYNPKTEAAADSAALALRLARNTGR